MATRKNAKDQTGIIGLVAGVGLLLSFMAAPRTVYADPLGAGGGTIYRLDAPSNYQHGCFEPCLCPLQLVQDIRGTMKLTYLNTDPNSGDHHYAVNEVNWIVPLQDQKLRVIGSGTYEIASPFPGAVVQHRMQLHLRVGNEPAELFDSGWVPIDANSGIHIIVSMNGMYCFDTVFTIAATPVPPDQIRPYALVDGSTYQHGCFDPCDCLLEAERPMGGRFELVPLLDNGTVAEFALVNVHWTVPDTAAGNVGIPISGFGIYERFAEFAVQQRLMLELALGDQNRAHFDSGFVVAMVPFPRIDIVVSMNNLVCLDTVLHVVAEPSGGDVCGGFAGIPCPEGQFCKYPVGSCQSADIFGVCAPIPGGCPDVWEPVCGCDGVTYGNECEADAAMMTIEHFGPCEVICEPDPGGFGCVQVPCSPVPEEMCIASRLHLDIATGAITTLACECRDTNACHIEFGNASPFAVGTCPPGAECRVFAVDTDGDGIDDEFAAHCVPNAIGACCLDVDDGPVAFDTCVSTDEQTCLADGGVFSAINSACDDVQACCLGVAGVELCQDMNPMCCVLSGGSPQGVGSNCADLPSVGGCGQACGGIAGIPCDDPTQFCMLPPGACCCDFLGVCTTPPPACTEEYNPVCGCDGVTYGNPCEAATASQSIDHFGPCENGCPDTWDPVCGVDGVTYQNACFAEQAGVPIRHPGECGAVCGGLGPYPPCPDTEFCKFPPGVCGDPTVPGECRPFPDVCPDVWAPVCGCDGSTYGNECEADAAGVSIDHVGECAVTACAATRTFAGSPAHCPGVPLMLHILITPPPGVTAVALEDTPPVGWVVDRISDGGTFDAVHGKVKWGPFFAPNIPAEVSYTATPPAADIAPACFVGMISLDGINQVICGDECVDVTACCPFMEADQPQRPCAGCPAEDCSDPAASSCMDGQITLRELIGYSCAWMIGCNDDLSGMTRAAYIWRNGECYCWDETDHNWHPTTCPGDASGCCTSPAVSAGIVGGDGGSVVAEITSSRVKRGGRLAQDGPRAGMREIRIDVSFVPPAGTSATALEMEIPQGWSVVSSSDGQWDEVHHKIKWGPIFGDAAAAVNFTVRRTPSEGLPIPHRYATGIPLRGLTGTISFDGMNRPISMR